MSSLDRRLHPRANVSIPGTVYLKSDPSKNYAAEILDLSIGGAFVHCTAPILIGQEILLEILFEQSKMNLNARVVQSPANNVNKQPSVVRWVRGSSKSGFGVQFVSLNDTSKAYLQQLVDAMGAT
jgi:Tfp pilus assembly protein PilZ